jgi:glycosyltransferase involved in cell wall biosynthesis
VIRVAYFSFDDIRFPSPVYRVFAPLLQLEGKVVLLSALTILGDQRHENPAALEEADVVLVQRGFPRSATAPICERIFASGKPVIYETDDALQCLPAHQNKPIYADDVGPAIEKFAKRVDLVTVSTPTLAALFRESARRVMVLPNCLSADLWTDDLCVSDKADPSRVRIGFVGSANHDRDFATILPLLKDTLEKYPNAEVVSIGGVSGDLMGQPRFSVVPPDYDYAQHPRRLAQARIDIALAPLTPSRFNRCKSNIKFLEFGFLGVPGIFADLEPYRDSVVHGQTGFLCDARLGSWRESLFALIEDEELRTRVGRAAKQAVGRSWMLQGHAEQWLRAYESAAKTKGGKR